MCAFKVQMEGMKEEHLLLAVSFYISSTGDPVFISLTSVTARKAASYVQTLKAETPAISDSHLSQQSSNTISAPCRQCLNILVLER